MFGKGSVGTMVKTALLLACCRSPMTTFYATAQDMRHKKRDPLSTTRVMLTRKPVWLSGTCAGRRPSRSGNGQAVPHPAGRAAALGRGHAFVRIEGDADLRPQHDRGRAVFASHGPSGPTAWDRALYRTGAHGERLAFPGTMNAVTRIAEQRRRTRQASRVLDHFIPTRPLHGRSEQWCIPTMVPGGTEGVVRPWRLCDPRIAHRTECAWCVCGVGNTPVPIQFFREIHAEADKIAWASRRPFLQPGLEPFAVWRRGVEPGRSDTFISCGHGMVEDWAPPDLWTSAGDAQTRNKPVRGLRGHCGDRELAATRGRCIR